MAARLTAFLAVLATPALADLAALQRPGAVALMRHATAPGTGDPPGFRLGDCATQRNLSGEGRAEAQRTGAMLREGGIAFSHVFASEWCRATETAGLLGLGPVVSLRAANSFFEDRGVSARQTAALVAALSRLPPGSRAIVVTHQVNITALTGVVPRSGEIVVAAPDGRGGYAAIGRIAPP